MKLHFNRQSYPQVIGLAYNIAYVHCYWPAVNPLWDVQNIEIAHFCTYAKANIFKERGANNKKAMPLFSFMPCAQSRAKHGLRAFFIFYDALFCKVAQVWFGSNGLGHWYRQTHFCKAGLQESGLVYFAQIDAASSAQLEIMLPVRILMGILQAKIPMSLCIRVKKLFEKSCNLPFLCLVAWILSAYSLSRTQYWFCKRGMT